MPSQTPNRLRVVGNLAAYFLIVASATFGCIYGYNISQNHGKIMSLATILMVLGLEFLKPLSVQYSFACFQRFQFIRGILLALLAIVAIAYSLVAELSLLYSARSDLAAQRKSESFHATSSQDQYENAKKELASLPKARTTTAEVQAEITILQSKYKNVDWDCEDIRDKQSKLACPLQAKLKSEIAIIERREKLQGTIDNFVNKPPNEVEKLADPSAAAIQTYVGLFGVTVDQSTIAQYVVLIPILALELGSALGLLLVSAINESPRIAVSHGVSAIEPPDYQPGRAARRAVMRQLADRDQAEISQRKLAKQEGLDKSTIQRAMHELQSEGVIDLETHRKGTVLRLKKA